MAGVTTEGFVRKTQAEIIAEFQQDARENIDPLIEYSDEDPLGQLFGILSAPLAEVWEVAEEVYHSYDRDSAEGDALENIGGILGVRKGEASRSLVTCAMGCDPGTIVPAGSIIAVEGNETVRFTLVEDFDADTDDDPEFQSEELGPVQALAGTLTVIVSAVSGWNGVSNAEDAEPGDVVQTTAAFRQSIRDATTRQGGSSTEAVRADILALNDELDGTPVIACKVFENLTSAVDENGLPPRSIEVLVYAPTVDDQDIAIRIWRSKPAGITTYGNDGEIVVDANGDDQEVLFSRPEAVPIALVYTVETVAAEYAGSAAVKTYIVEQAQARFGHGKDLVEVFLKSLPLGVAGVYNVTAFTMAVVGDSPIAGVLPISLREIGDFDVANITINVDPWVDQ